MNAIDTASPTDGADVAAFLRSLPLPDLWLRFGGRPDWLLERLFRDAERGATLARRHGRIVGVLDYVHTGCGLEIGVVVAERHRRLGVASAMLAATLARAPYRGEAVLAYASWGNVPAVRWLQRNGFGASGGSAEPLLFVHASARCSAV